MQDLAPAKSLDFIGRIKSTLPPRWFPATTPILDGLLTGLASTWAWLYDQVIILRNQTRLATATGGMLDAIAQDFTGSRLLRQLSEPDGNYRARIKRELLRERGTRQALVSALFDLTGRTPHVFEPARPADTGSWNGPLGYGAAGAWGSLSLPYQFLVTAFRPQGTGIAVTSGYNGKAGYGTASVQYGSLLMLTGQVTDTDILSTISDVIPVATIAWSRISD